MLRARSMSDPVTRKATGPDTGRKPDCYKNGSAIAVSGVWPLIALPHMCFHLFDQNMLIAIF